MRKTKLFARMLAAVVLLAGGAALSACGAQAVSHLPKPVLDAFSLFSLTQAQRRVDDALALAAEKGDAETIRLINEEQLFWEGDSYVFVLDARTKTIVGHPVAPELVGKKLESVADVAGNSLLELLNADESGNWVEYKWTPPGNDKFSRKISWVKLSGNYIYGSGAYEEE
ncbi:MAG: hypothetical protein HAW59_02895 [Betaproteobacteria bacterium]|nr:hypothetical protein [Betaproteobacteria bacterium]